LEEEDELEVLGNLLEGWANRGDGDELGDVEEERKDNHRNNVMNYNHLVTVLPRLFLEILFHDFCSHRWDHSSLHGQKIIHCTCLQSHL
jgi:hypothetical protein